MIDYRFANDSDLTIDEVVDHIVWTHKQFDNDWGNGAWGWAPDSAARLLEASRLDWLVSLAHNLRLWTKIQPSTDSHDGALILAWANLGSLVEGAMKFFLCVYEHDYANSVSAKKTDSVYKMLWDREKQQPKDVDGLMFERLRAFFEQEVFAGMDKQDWSGWLRHIQERRNTIHAYKTRDLGSFEEFSQDVRKYRKFLLDEISNLPDSPRAPDYG